MKVTNTVKLLTLATKAISSRKTKDMAMIMERIVAIQEHGFEGGQMPGLGEAIRTGPCRVDDPG